MRPVAFGSFDSLRKRGPMINTSTQSGTFTKKMPRQENASIRSEPTTGPTTAPSAPVAPETPIAVARRVGGNSGNITANPAANVIDPPMACTQRAAISNPRRRRESAQQRADPEDRHAGQVHLSAPDRVGQPSRHHEQRADDDVVGADDPAQVGVGDLEVFADRRERDIHRRDVDDDEEHDGRRDRQREPRPARNRIVDVRRYGAVERRRGVGHGGDRIREPERAPTRPLRSCVHGRPADARFGDPSPTRAVRPARRAHRRTVERPEPVCRLAGAGRDRPSGVDPRSASMEVHGRRLQPRGLRQAGEPARHGVPRSESGRPDRVDARPRRQLGRASRDRADLAVDRHPHPRPRHPTAARPAGDQ